MSVRLICNGYFRSGTSIVWKILRESNPDCLVFYEPCHERLFIQLERFNNGRKTDSLHRMSLWDEYFKKEGFIDSLRFTHPNVGSPFPESARDLLEYVKVFDALQEDTVLQVNRWHFYLGDLSKHFSASVMHIIRNPVDIFESFHSNYPQGRNPIIIFVKKSLSAVFFARAFSQKGWFRTVYERFGKPSFLTDKLKYAVFQYTRPFDVFFVVWVLTNAAAIRSLGKRDLLMVHECLLRRPGYYQSRIKDLFGLGFAYGPLLKKDGMRVEFMEEAEFLKLREKAEELGMLVEFEFVVNSIRNCEQEAGAWEKNFA